MGTLLVSYDLGVPEDSADYKKLHNYLKEYQMWAKPLYSQYFIVTSKTAGTVRDEIQQLIDKNDKVLVINVTGKGWATNFSNKVTEWMKKNI
jgi:vacuolar-type H+-ATPase subunit F/Vma7